MERSGRSTSYVHVLRLLCLVCILNVFESQLDPLRELIVKSKSNCNFRKSANIEVPRPGTEIGRSSFKHRAALRLNLLPNSFKNSPSLGFFKRLIRENKNFLKTISFEKASCSICLKSMDFYKCF